MRLSGLSSSSVLADRIRTASSTRRHSSAKVDQIVVETVCFLRIIPSIRYFRRQARPSNVFPADRLPWAGARHISDLQQLRAKSTALIGPGPVVPRQRYSGKHRVGIGARERLRFAAATATAREAHACRAFLCTMPGVETEMRPQPAVHFVR